MHGGRLRRRAAARNLRGIDRPRQNSGLVELEYLAASPLALRRHRASLFGPRRRSAHLEEFRGLLKLTGDRFAETRMPARSAAVRRAARSRPRTRVSNAPQVGGSTAVAAPSFFSSGLGVFSLPPLIVIGIFVCVSWTGLWLDAPHWARGARRSALALGPGRLPAARSALFVFPRARRRSTGSIAYPALRSHPAAVIERPTRQSGRTIQRPAPSGTCTGAARDKRVALLRTGGPSPRMVDLDRYALRAIVLVGLVATGFRRRPRKIRACSRRHSTGASTPCTARATESMPGSILPPIPAKPPIVLNLGGNKSSATSDPPQQIEAPGGSIVVIHALPRPSGHEHHRGPRRGGEGQKHHGSSQHGRGQSGHGKGEPRLGETRLILRGDAMLTLGRANAPPGAVRLFMRSWTSRRRSR